MTRDVEGVVAKLTEAQRDWVLANKDSHETPLPESVKDVDWADGDPIWNGLAEMGVCEFWTTRLTPLGIEVRAHLLAQDKSQ